MRPACSAMFTSPSTLSMLMLLRMEVMTVCCIWSIWVLSAAVLSGRPWSSIRCSGADRLCSSGRV